MVAADRRYSLTYGFDALKMRVEDLQAKGSGWLMRLHEKGCKQHMMPCHHAPAKALHAYIAAASISADQKRFLSGTSRGHDGAVLSERRWPTHDEALRSHQGTAYAGRDREDYDVRL